MMIVIYRYYAEVCLFVTKNLHFLQKKMCTFWTFWISNLRAASLRLRTPQHVTVKTISWPNDLGYL